MTAGTSLADDRDPNGVWTNTIRDVHFELLAVNDRGSHTVTTKWRDQPDSHWLTSP